MSDGVIAHSDSPSQHITHNDSNYQRGDIDLATVNDLRNDL